MKTMVVVLMSLIVAVAAADSVAQTAGSSVVSVSVSEVKEVAKGWSAKKQILGKDVYNDTGDKIGEINDLIVAPNKTVSYAIVGVGGFLGVGERFGLLYLSDRHLRAPPALADVERAGRARLGAGEGAVSATPFPALWRAS